MTTISIGGLLMTAGELDISVGAMVPFGAMTVAVISGHYGLSIWAGVAVALSFGVLVGLITKSTSVALATDFGEG
jgi:simple sugar transport system permease protein